MKRVTPTEVQIDREAIRFNFRQLKRCLPRHASSLCVVKSNAYGHGAQEVAKVLDAEGTDWFGVGTIDEGVALRKAVIKKPILILLGIMDEALEDLFRYQLTPVVYDMKTVTQLHRFFQKKKRICPVHIKIDTGMTRLGVLPDAFSNFCRALKRLSFIEPQGLLTHFAEAGDASFTQAQEMIFEKAKLEFEKVFPEQKGKVFFHQNNSQATIDRRFGHPDELVMARLGIALYGAYPLERDRKMIKLQPALTWKTRLVAIKEVSRGTTVSYNRTFTTRHQSRIGILPVGYADGYPRILSNRASVLIRGRRVPVVGIVCMDMMMVDLTSLPRVHTGDEVVLIGRQGKARIEAEELAALAGTISYEIFCRISERVPRYYR